MEPLSIMNFSRISAGNFRDMQEFGTTLPKVDKVPRIRRRDGGGWVKYKVNIIMTMSFLVNDYVKQYKRGQGKSSQHKLNSEVLWLF